MAADRNRAEGREDSIAVQPELWILDREQQTALGIAWTFSAYPLDATTETARGLGLDNSDLRRDDCSGLAGAR